MNISRENLDDLNAVIRIDIEPADYQPKVDSALIEYRKKARFDGFRPGKVPPSLIRKMYGKSIQAEEIQRLLSDTLNSYIQDNQLKILGEPLPNENSSVIDWDTAETFEFHFDIAMAPEIELNIAGYDAIPDYKIIITPDMIDKQVEEYAHRFGSLQPTETISDEDVVKGDLCELSDHDHDHDHDHEHLHDHDHDQEEEHPHRHPIHALGTLIYIKTIVDEEIKTQFLNAKVGDSIVFNPNTAFPNETDRATLLKVSREELSTIDTDFEFTIDEASHFTAAEINQELFDKAFGEGEIDTVEAFRERIEEDLKRQVARESQYKFHIDAKAKLMADTHVPLPEDFLKRWMLLSSKDKSLTMEELEKDFPAFINDLKWRMIKNTIITDQKLEATEEEIREQALWAAQSRYFQYGIYDAPADQLFKLADVLLKNEEEQTRIADVILENKVIGHVKTLIKLTEENISREEFNKLRDESKR